MRFHSYLLAGIMFAAGLPARAEVENRPNIIVVLTDDMGYSDIGCFGSEIRTPNLDRLAHNGIRMSQFYNAARCCPSRASLLTGLYPHSTGVGCMTGWDYPEHANKDGYQKSINEHCVTIAQVLKPAGYRTYAVGKWHVSDKMKGDGRDRKNWPLQRGFDSFYGTLAGAGSFYDPAWLMRDNELISPYADSQYKPDVQYYYTDAISDHAVENIRRHAGQNNGSPFFMYVAYTAAHWPMHAPEEEVAKYRGAYDQGYDAIRQSRFERLKQEGLISRDWKLSETVGNWSAVEDKLFEARCMEVYAAMVTRMDQGVGRLVGELEKTGLLDNTLILYLHDNGACAEDFGHTERAEWNVPDAPMSAEDIQRRVVPPIHTRSGKTCQNGPDTLPGPDGTYVSYGENWANVCNTPFRNYKQHVHEGGVASPLIAHWPRGIVMPGRIAHDPAHLIDIMATCIDVAGADYPEQLNGHSIHPLPGTSLRPVFKNHTLPQRTFFWEHQGSHAIRSGDWKLVADGAEARWALYNLKNDRTEQVDVSAQYPERAVQLAAEWTQLAEQNNALPWPWGISGDGYVLRPGDSYGGVRSPDLSGKSFAIVANGIFSEQSTGVICAQGDSSHGFALFCENGRLCFGVRFSKELYDQVSIPLTASSQVEARWQEGKGMAVFVNGQVAEKPLMHKQLFEKKPDEFISCGSDKSQAVGIYLAPFKFSGKIDQVTLRNL